MKKIRVKAEYEYEISIGVDWRSELASLLPEHGRAALVVSKSLAKQVRGFAQSNTEIQILEIPDGESGKNLPTLESLWNSFGNFGLTRGDLVIAIGGGATTDIVGFAAATWLRGIHWIAIPTSLAGMVDAAVGGKTGMNSQFGKNLIGAFHSPQRVIIDLAWLETLPDRDFAAGLAEVVKCGFISDTNILDLIEGKSLSVIRIDQNIVEELISRAVDVKARVVSEDFRESYAREVLNYGHTMGHAIEQESQYSLRHGEAVAIGMVFVANLAHLKGVLSLENVLRHQSILHALGLPTTYSHSALPDLLPFLYRDKKTRGRTLRFIAVGDDGEILRLEGVTEIDIAAAYGKVAS
jgi:3-dehydroquinate synthase